jgi:hypothetical protein
MKALGALFDLIQVIGPLDLQTARSGDYVSLKNAEGVGFLVIKGVGTAGEDPDITLRQAQAVAGTNAKDLDKIATYWKKQGADMTAIGTWTKVTQTADALIDADGTSAEEMALYYFEVLADELDVDGGFDCVTVNIGDVGTNAQLGAVIAILFGLKKAAAPEDLVNSITN